MTTTRNTDEAFARMVATGKRTQELFNRSWLGSRHSDMLAERLDRLATRAEKMGRMSEFLEALSE